VSYSWGPPGLLLTSIIEPALSRSYLDGPPSLDHFYTSDFGRDNTSELYATLDHADGIFVLLMFKQKSTLIILSPHCGWMAAIVTWGTMHLIVPPTKSGAVPQSPRQLGKGRELRSKRPVTRPWNFSYRMTLNVSFSSAMDVGSRGPRFFLIMFEKDEMRCHF
jgi:hypothetical protein